MRRIQRLLTASLSLLMLGLLATGSGSVRAVEPINVPALTISQLKITSSNGQFVTLYNATNTMLDMSKYQLEYFNSYDLSKATSSRLIALSGTVPPHGYYLVNDSSLTLCYQQVVDSVSLGFSSTAGMVEVLGFNQASVGASVVPSLQDYIGWSKTAATGAQTLPTNTDGFLQRQPVDAGNNPQVSSPGSGSWLSVHPDATNACSLVTNTTAPTSVKTGLSQLLPLSEPPASIVEVASDSIDAPAVRTLPPADVGLQSPQVTELLPNPDGTGNDSTDEYIELYNPNKTGFDLSGFALQVGVTSLHEYIFPSGTLMQPQSFTAFYSDQTGLSLSNTAGQAKLLDPSDKPVTMSDPYTNAKDGQAWALANGKWSWTTVLTPNAANIITQPKSTKKAKTSTAKKVTAAAVKGAKTTKLTKQTAAVGAANEPTTSPIHFTALAIVVCLALLYGAYEYRTDLANRIHQLKNYASSRRPDRRKTEGR